MINKNIIEKKTINEIKYFLVCFWNKTIKQIESKKRIKGILLPERRIPTKKIRNRIGIVYFKYLWLRLLKKIGIIKKENIENLWM